jgi:very-short-patch-repair endonuclease
MWQSWATSRQRPTAVVGGDSRRQWLDQWIKTLLQGRDLYLNADAYISRRLSPPGEASSLRLGDKTAREIELTLENAQLSDFGLEPDRLCCWLLRLRAQGATLSDSGLLQTQMCWLDATSTSVGDAFRQIIGLLADPLTPTLLALSGHTSLQDIDSFCRLAHELVMLVASVPDLTVGICVETSLWTTYLRKAPEGFTKSVLLDGVIPIEKPSGNSACLAYSTHSMLNSEPHVPETMANTQQPFVARAASSIQTGSEHAKATCSEGGQQLVGGEIDVWKSEAERFLFELLESSDLQGLFQLNAKPGFLFGNHQAEIDLACLDLKIAIEVDGFFHFQSLDNYRRDRRKDVELQRHGYVVVRFLAQDVVSEMSEILATIRSAVEFRKLEFGDQMIGAERL